MLYSSSNYAEALYAVLSDKDERKAKKAIVKFVADMKARGLVALLPSILREMPEVIRRADDVQEVTVETATEISDLTARKAAALVCGGEVEVVSRLNPDMIGGIKVRGRNSSYDATLRSRLERLRELLKG